MVVSAAAVQCHFEPGLFVINIGFRLRLNAVSIEYWLMSRSVKPSRFFAFVPIKLAAPCRPLFHPPNKRSARMRFPGSLDEFRAGKMTKFHRLIDRICAHSNDAAHGVEIPAGARLLFTNGQVGLRPYGKVPTDTSDQIEIICERLQFILEART